MADWQIGDYEPTRDAPTPRESMAVVASLLGASAMRDDQAAVLVVESLSTWELRGALHMAVSLLAGNIQKRPGGLALWLQTWRERDQEVSGE